MIEIANNHSNLNNRINNEIFVRTLFVRSMDQMISSKTHMCQRNRRAYEKKKKKKKERNNSLSTESETVRELFIFEECD